MYAASSTVPVTTANPNTMKIIVLIKLTDCGHHGKPIGLAKTKGLPNILD
jgi:hypothetical protein